MIALPARLAYGLLALGLTTFNAAWAQAPAARATTEHHHFAICTPRPLESDNGREVTREHHANQILAWCFSSVQGRHRLIAPGQP